MQWCEMRHNAYVRWSIVCHAACYSTGFLQMKEKRRPITAMLVCL